VPPANDPAATEIAIAVMVMIRFIAVFSPSVPAIQERQDHCCFPPVPIGLCAAPREPPMARSWNDW
jgi:hypothetical protein